MSAWFSYTNESSKLADSVDAKLLPFFETVAHIEPSNNGVSLVVLKANGKEVADANLKLDAKTLLMSM